MQAEGQGWSILFWTVQPLCIQTCAVGEYTHFSNKGHWHRRPHICGVFSIKTLEGQGQVFNGMCLLSRVHGTQLSFLTWAPVTGHCA